MLDVVKIESAPIIEGGLVSLVVVSGGVVMGVAIHAGVEPYTDDILNNKTVQQGFAHYGLDYRP